jgi:hypothetical protein
MPWRLPAPRSLANPQPADLKTVIYMNRNRLRAHPMQVDVDLKEGYPDGRA